MSKQFDKIKQEEAMEVQREQQRKSSAAAPQVVADEPVAAAISYWKGPTHSDGTPRECGDANIGRWLDYEPTTLKHGNAIKERGDPDKRVKFLFDAAPVPAQEPRKPTDISQRLREKVACGTHPDFKADILAAADEIERYYGGMMNWKATAEAKDRDTVQAQEPVGFGLQHKETGRFGSCLYTTEQSAMIAKHEDAYYNGPIELYTRTQPAFVAPVQPVAVPDDVRKALVLASDAMANAWSWIKETDVAEDFNKAGIAIDAILAAPAAQDDAKDAERWRETLMHVGATVTGDIGARFTLRFLEPVEGTDLMRGGVAGHFADAIDAAIAAKAAS